MILLTNNIEPVISFLKEDEFINLNIIGTIENCKDIQVYVDNVDKPNSVFVKKDYFNFLYSYDNNFIREVFKEFVVDCEIGFSGMKEDMAENISLNFTDDSCKVVWKNPCTALYLPKENIDLSKINHKVESLSVSDAKEVNQFYEFSGETSIDTIENDIKNRPSSCIRIDGELACWVLTHDDNSMGIAYTKKKFRRQGLALEATIDLASKVYKTGKTPYLQIIDSNDLSPGVAKNAGFIPFGRSTWFGIVEGIPCLEDELKQAFELFKLKLKEESKLKSNIENWYKENKNIIKHDEDHLSIIYTLLKGKNPQENIAGVIYLEMIGCHKLKEEKISYLINRAFNESLIHDENTLKWIRTKFFNNNK